MPTPDICGWSALAPEQPISPMLQQNLRADVVIIGGGVTGLAAARRMAEVAPEKRIVLIEAKRIAGGASARNSGFAVANAGPDPSLLSTAAGRAAYLRMHRIDVAGVGELRRMVQTHDIACQWDDSGSIHAARDARFFPKLRRHAELFTELGIDATILEQDALKARLGTGFYQLGVQSRGGALVQPAQLVQGLASHLPQQVELFEHSPAQALARSDGMWEVTLEQGVIRAKQVIVAVNAFLPRLGLKRLRLFPLALSASLTRPLKPDEEAEIGAPPAWGVLSPASLGATVRLTQDRRILMRNTAEYRPAGIDGAQLTQRRAEHSAGLSRRFPFLDANAIEYSWSGSICISRNSKPVFEENAPGLFLCGGYNASGLSRGTIMGRLIADLALKEPSDLLQDAMGLEKPTLIPPRPFFDFGVKLRMASDRKAALSEV